MRKFPSTDDALPRQQQARFGAFLNEFKGERPRKALVMKTPADVYAPSAKP
jgi:hypothetical protein